MTQSDIEKKQIVLIKYLQQIINKYSIENWKIKAEYSTNDNDKRVITVQEQSGSKEVFYADIMPLFNYYMIDIYGLSIQECKNISLIIGNLIGKSILIKYEKETWQIIFSQWVNAQAIEYMDIRRIGYNSTLKCIVNKAI